MQVYTLGRIVWRLKRKEKEATRFGFFYVTLMPYIIGHKCYFIWNWEFWVFGCNSCVILWLADFMHMKCRYTWMLGCLTFLNHILMCIHFSFFQFWWVWYVWCIIVLYTFDIQILLDDVMYYRLIPKHYKNIS